MNKLLLCALLLVLTGCETMPQGRPNIPESLLQECPQLYELEGMTGEALLNNITKNASVYHACKEGKKMLIDAVKAK